MPEDVFPATLETLEMDTFPAHPPRSVSRGHVPGRIRETVSVGLSVARLAGVGCSSLSRVTYMNTSAFALYLVPFQLRRYWRRRRGLEDPADRRGRAQYQRLAVDPEADERPQPEDPPILHSSSEENLPPLTIRETARLAFVFIANWAVNASLDYTSVASATILSSMSGFFTLAIGRIFRVEMLTLAKIAAVLTSFGGVLLVSLSDSVQPRQPGGAASRPLTNPTELAPRPILGDCLALVSAVFYASACRSESRVDMQLFFGFVGLFNILSCWPIGIFLHIIGVETFELPHRSAFAALAINMAITLSSDYLYVLAMLKTTPLVVTVGLSLTIPLAVIGDFILGRFTRGQVIFGALLVLLSFVVVGLDNDAVKTQEDVPKDRRRRVGHDPSVKLPNKRQFAVQDNAVEHVEIGGAAEQSAADLLHAMDAEPQTVTLKKKEKQMMKREALLQRLESTHSPYSKSHARRQKRKAKEQLGSGLDDIQLALAEVDEDAADEPAESCCSNGGRRGGVRTQTEKTKAETRADWRREGQMEKLRHPLILANAEFSSNPFQTIRTHAQNTLLATLKIVNARIVL
ncbi:ribosome biogenesis protein SLX9-domain-containing protein [Mycena metata]|uniref:Ribosome biogenesis protein SLX9 n=1 Tax=Mycena metata TaxID=1033252 RepID=A0AAD7P3K9_9AGAR|nr:ribosome biogenesis protein SLX9-domain-containing protein [Mycena metata]